MKRIRGNEIARPDPSLGWTRSYRAVVFSEAYRSLPFLHRELIHQLLALAARRPYTPRNAPADFVLQSGQVLTSTVWLARWIGAGTSRFAVGRALRHLARLGILSLHPAPVRGVQPHEDGDEPHGYPLQRGLVVTISFWDEYYAPAGGRAHRSAHRNASDPHRNPRFRAHKREEPLYKNGYTRRVSSSSAVPAVRPGVLIAFTDEFHRDADDRDRVILADLNGFPDDAVRAAFRETHEKKLELTYARAVLRYQAANGAGKGAPA